MAQICYIIIFCFFATSVSAQEKNNIHDTVTIITLNDQASSLWRSHPDSSKVIANQARILSTEIDFLSGKANSYNNLGAVNFFQAEYDSAYYYWNLALKEWQKAKNKSQEAKMLSNLSIALRERNKTAEAIRFSQKAIELQTFLKDSIALAISYNNLGIMYYGLSIIEKALYFHHKALSIRKAVPDSVRISSTYINLGSVYSLTGNLDSASYFLHEALNLDTINGDKWGSATAYGKIAELHFLKNSLNESLLSINNALALANELAAKHLILELTLWKAKILVERKEFIKALKCIESADEILKDQDLSTEVSRTELLAKIFAATGDYERSTLYYQRHLREKDSLQKANTESTIAEITAKYYYDLREQELKNKQELREAELQQIIVNKQLATTSLWVFMIFIIILLIISLLFILLVRSKNRKLKKQREEINVLVNEQKEIIENKTEQLLLSKNTISRYAFLNSHELRAPLARILGVIQLSDKNVIEEETFISTIKVSANELEEAVKKISKELNKY